MNRLMNNQNQNNQNHNNLKINDKGEGYIVLNNKTKLPEYNNISVNSDIEKLRPNKNNNLSSRIVDLVNKHIRLDQDYRHKHNELVTLFNEYKRFRESALKDKNRQLQETYENKLENLNNKIKDNESHMHKGRLLIIAKLKDDNLVSREDKKYLANKLSVVFGFGLKKKTKKNLFHLNNNNNNTKKLANSEEVDKAYLEKHNELMTLFKAYKKLYGKVLTYKDELNQYKSIKLKSKITRSQLNNMKKDQRLVMSTLDQMQDDLIEKKVFTEDERIDVRKKCDDQIDMVNSTLRQQINKALDKDDTDLEERTKENIENILREPNERNRHKKIRKIILFKRN